MATTTTAPHVYWVARIRPTRAADRAAGVKVHRIGYPARNTYGL